MTELNDHLKLLFARAGHLHCRRCGEIVRRDSAESIYAALEAHGRADGSPRLLICFIVPVPKNFKENEVLELLGKQGYTRIRSRRKSELEVVQDRVRLPQTDRARVLEAIEAALRAGRGRIRVHALRDSEAARDPARVDTAEAESSWHYSDTLQIGRAHV